MKQINKSDVGYKPAQFIVILFSSFAISSCLYSIITKTYNGDFLGQVVNLSIILLLVNLIFTITPYWFLWKIYKFFKKREINRSIPIRTKSLEYFVLILLILNLILTILFGVGKAASEVYDAPAYLKPFIQIINRIDVGYLSFLFILISNNKVAIYRTVILLIVISALKASIGIFLFLFLIFGIKYYLSIKEYLRNKKTIILLFIFVFPFFVQTLYEIRDQLRYQNNEKLELSVTNLIFGKLVGRLSSFSNSAQIIQEPIYFVLQSKSLDEYYFQKQAIGGVIGGTFLPKQFPEFLMIESLGNTSRTTAFMCGTQGNLMISILKSTKVFVFNIITIMLMVLLSFYLIRKLKFNYANEYALILLIYPITSGVANEYSMVLFSSFFLTALFIITNALIKITKPNVKYTNDNHN